MQGRGCLWQSKATACQGELPCLSPKSLAPGPTAPIYPKSHKGSRKCGTSSPKGLFIKEEFAFWASMEILLIKLANIKGGKCKRQS